MSLRAANVGVKVGHQTEWSGVGGDWCSSTPTRTTQGVAIDCALAGASSGSVEELTCPPPTIYFALLGSRSSLPATRGESPSGKHSACPCEGRVADQELLREAKGLHSPSAACAVSPVASASSSGLGTICLCENRIGKCRPYTVPLARGSFRRFSRISPSEDHGCPQ